MPYVDPDRARTYQRDYRRLRRAGDGCTTLVHPDIPTGLRLATAADVGDVLDGQIAAVVASRADALGKARVIGYLCAVRLRAIEAGNLAARIEALESVLRRRNGDDDR
jgi:hypothetical protein